MGYFKKYLGKNRRVKLRNEWINMWIAYKMYVQDKIIAVLSGTQEEKAIKVVS